MYFHDQTLDISIVIYTIANIELLDLLYFFVRVNNISKSILDLSVNIQFTLLLYQGVALFTGINLSVINLGSKGYGCMIFWFLIFVVYALFMEILEIIFGEKGDFNNF